MRPLRSSPSSRVLPWPCRPPVVPLVACGRFRRARRLRREGHRFQRRARRHRPLRAERARRGRSGSGRIRGRERAVVAAVEAELGSDWPKQVAPRFDANKAILFDDRWASAREDLARAYYDNDPAALNGSFIGLARPSPPKPVVRQRVGERRTQGRLPEGRLRGPRTGCVQQERLPLRE